MIETNPIKAVTKQYEVETDDAFGIVEIQWYHSDWYNNVPKANVLSEHFYYGSMSDEDIVKNVVKQVEKNMYGWSELEMEAKEV